MLINAYGATEQALAGELSGVAAGVRLGGRPDIRLRDPCWGWTGAGLGAAAEADRPRVGHHLDVAAAHHWKPRLSDWAVDPDFDGVVLHSHGYVSPFEPVEIRGKTVIVVGMGNSAMDIASELSSSWMAEKLYVSARRGVWVLPKYRNGQPADKVMAPPDIPKEVALAAGP